MGAKLDKRRNLRNSRIFGIIILESERSTSLNLFDYFNKTTAVLSVSENDFLRLVFCLRKNLAFKS